MGDASVPLVTAKASSWARDRTSRHRFFPPSTLAGGSGRREAAQPDPPDHSLGVRQFLDHALAGPIPLLQEDQEIGHLLPVRPLVELPDDVGADLAGGGQDPKEIPTRGWSERVSEASRVLPKHRARAYQRPLVPLDVRVEWAIECRIG